MEIENVIKLIDAVSSANIMNFQIEEGNFRLSMDKLTQKTEVPVGVVSTDSVQTVTVPNEIKNTQTAASINSNVIEKQEDNINIVSKAEIGAPVQAQKEAVNIKIMESPIVGTYYSAAGPDSKDFVSVGDVVKEGQVLCIVEAMKLMNDIESEYAGEIVEILVKNEQMVEYGQPLFKIKV